ncbi:MAG: TrpB-like pyridoxal phosphate-dependent enzyme [Polyangiaceae bacterium]|nr:TrpB-like pyridoxal phosphate-dependent enzyme [Polyangiaceae bacterium]
MSQDTIKYLLSESDQPKSWYNIQADLPELPPPYLHPVTKRPATADDLAPLFPMSLIMQEMTREREIEIPEPVRDVYRQWRPSPLYRARRLERLLDTPAKIYYKHEGVSPTGSHKPNTAVAQAFYNMAEGVKKMTTETGAGQWGSSLAFAAQIFGLELEVYMVKVSLEQKPYRGGLINLFGATVHASPSELTAAGRAILAKDPNCSGSLGIAISEAVERAVTTGAKYGLGSVLNHVLMHQTIVGLEAMKQMELAGDDPDVLIGSVGGGSNFAGLVFPFLGQQLREGGKKRRVIGVEPAACPTVTRGKYAYDYGDTIHMAPIAMMHTLGSTFIPPPFHAGGLRYHGMAPLVSKVVELGLAEAVSYHQTKCFEAGVSFARTEGITPAPEANHAICAAIDEALRCKLEGKSQTILFNLSGHGHFDMQSYIDYFSGKLKDIAVSQEEIAMALAGLPSAAG